MYSWAKHIAEKKPCIATPSGERFSLSLGERVRRDLLCMFLLISSSPPLPLRAKNISASNKNKIGRRQRPLENCSYNANHQFFPAPRTSQCSSPRSRRVESCPPRGNGQVKSTRRCGQCCWSKRFVQVRLHHVARLVADVIRIAVRIRHVDQIARRRTDADGEKSQSILGRVFLPLRAAPVSLSLSSRSVI